MPEETQTKPKPNADPASTPGESAYTQLVPQLAALAEDKLVPFRVDLQKTSITVGAVCDFLAEAESVKRFGWLKAEAFDPKHIVSIGLLGPAAGYAHFKLTAARGHTTTAKLPSGLAENADAIWERMQRLLAYILAANDSVQKDLAALRGAQGYAARATALFRVSELYVTHKTAIEHDLTNYRATDAAEARAVAVQIEDELGRAQTAEEQNWVEQCSRVWTLLEPAYAEVRAAGLYLWRHDDGEEKFPSLFQHEHVGRPKKKTE